MNFKKTIALVLALVLALSLVACGVTTPKADASESDAAQSGSTADEYTLDYADYFDENGNWIGFTAADYVTLPENFDKMEVPAAEVEVSEEDLNEMLNNVLSSFAEATKVTDRAVEDGDTVNIDYVGSIDGVEFDGGSTGGAGTDVTIGVTSYIDDFLEQLIGHTPGETFNVEVTFPEDYGVDELNGKDAVFVTTINYIEGESIIPELTDEFVAENLSEIYEVSTVAELTAYLNDYQHRMNLENYLVDALMAESTWAEELPEVLIAYQKASMLSYYSSFASSYGMTTEDFLTTYFGTADVDEIFADEDIADDMEESNKQYVLFQAISDATQLEISEDDFQAFMVDYIGDADSAQSYIDAYGINYWMMVARRNLSDDYVINNAVVK